MADQELTYEAAFPGRFTKAALFNGKHVTLTVTRGYMEVLEGDKGKENKLILSFKETQKELCCNKTNALCLKEMFTNKVADWVGKRVTFFPTRVAFGPKQVEAIRIFGSPDIAGDVEVAARIGRKNFKATMHKTGTKAAPAAQPVVAAMDADEDDGPAPEYDFGMDPIPEDLADELMGQIAQ